MIHRTCKACEIIKEQSAFYFNKVRNLFFGKCKDCYLAAKRKYREEHPELMRICDRANNVRFRNTASGKRTVRKHSINWRNKNPLKRTAQRKVNNAIKCGRLVRKNCEVCNAAKVDAHHDDYEKPLTVRWLCRKHHVDWHRGNI